jgi:hypothetical protein
MSVWFKLPPSGVRIMDSLIGIEIKPWVELPRKCDRDKRLFSLFHTVHTGF